MCVYFLIILTDYITQIMISKLTSLTVLIFLMLFSLNKLSATEIILNPGDNLQAAINNAQGGDVIIVNGGNYAGTIHIQNRSFTATNPLIIRNGNGTPHITGSGSYSGGTTFRITNSSYIVLDGLKLSNSLYGCFITLSDHIIVKNCEITDTGQEGLHARDDIEYVDVIDCHIHHTGRRPDHEGWGEGIYIGGSSTNVPTRFVFIEGNEIYECGLGEGINVKASDSEKVTVTNNHVHYIHPGKSTSPNAQWNGGAIAVSHHFTSTDRQIWIQNNLIEDVYGGQVSNSGIMTQQSNTRVINNTIRNCGDRGIWFNDFESTSACWNFGNTFVNNGTNVFIASGAQVFTTNPGLSPFVAQSWYDDSNSQDPDPNNGDNIALTKPVVVSSQQAGNEGTKAVDGNRAEINRWSAESYPQSIEIDLQGTFKLDKIDVFPLSNRAYQYTVETKTNGNNYQMLIDRSNNTEGGPVISDSLTEELASQVKFTFTGAAVYDGVWISIREIEIFGTQTTIPNTPAQLIESEGDVFISDINSGIIMISPDGSCHRMKVNNAGQFISESVECPN